MIRAPRAWRRWTTLVALAAGLVLPLPAQTPGLLLVQVTPKVVERDRSVSWEEPLSKTVASGVPVVVNIDAEELAIRISLTAFLRDGEILLVVQGDVKDAGPQGARRSRTLQTLSVPPGEPIVFFPLGRDRGPDGRQMLVLIKVGLRSD